MQIVKNAYTECELEDVIPYKTTIEKAFLGQSTDKPRYRVPGTDGTVILFDNLELVSRFISLSVPDQYDFIQAIKFLLHRHLVDEMQIKIFWKGSSKKILRVRALPKTDALYLDVVPIDSFSG